LHLAVSGLRGISRSDTAARARQAAVDALQPYCFMMTPEASTSETAPLQRSWTGESRRQFAKSPATLMRFCASLARVMVVSQVPVSIRPRHLQGLQYTLLAASFLTTLPVKAGALLRFSLQRFPPPPVSPPSPGRGPHAVGVSELLDFRAVAGRGPLEPRLPDPLLGFSPPGPPIPTPAVMPSRVTVPPCAWKPSSPQERRQLHSEGCSASGSAFLSRGSVPSWIFRPCSLLRIFGWHRPRDYCFSSAVPPPRGRLPASLGPRASDRSSTGKRSRSCEQEL
jgi:hypothetical protein